MKIAHLLKCRRVIIVALVVVTGGLAGVTSGSAVTEGSDWVVPSPYDLPRAVNGDGSLSSEDFDRELRSRYSVFADRTCVNHEYAQVPSGANMWGCWYDTVLGQLTRTGAAVRPTGKQAGPVNDWMSAFFPTKNPEIFIETPLNADDGNTGLRFWRAEDVDFTETWPQDTDAPMSYQLSSEGFHTVRKSDGSPYTFDNNLLYDHVWYSANGEWMLIRYDQGYVDLFNLNNFSSRRIQTMNEGFGSFAISNDGRYLAEAVFGAPPYVIDTQICEGIVCASRDLSSIFARDNGYPGFGYLPSFYDNGTIRMYSDPTGEYEEYIVQAPNTYGNKYLALGDSFASGEGASFYTKETADGKGAVNSCHVSKQSYAFLLGHWFDLERTNNIACSGAVMADMTSRAQYPRPINEISERQELLAGEYAQREYVQSENPDIITVSAGGNDIGFKGKIERCVKGRDTCFDSYEDRLEIAKEINRQYPKLIDTYRVIKTASRPGANVYAIGYPYILHDNGKCHRTALTFDAEEITFSKQIIDQLNSVMQAAARAAGVTFVDVSDALNGYRLCEIDMLEAAVNGFTIKKYDLLDYSISESYHPNTIGHQLLARAIADETSNFKKDNPRAQPSLSEPVVSSDNPLIRGRGQEGRQVRDKYFAPDLSPHDVVQSKSSLWASIRGFLYNIAKNTTYTLFVRSEPAFLGEFTSDDEGNIELEYSLPDDLEPGYHTLHLEGIGADGTPIDVYKDIYVPEEMHLVDATLPIITNQKNTSASSGTISALAITSDLPSQAYGELARTNEAIADEHLTSPKENIYKPLIVTAYGIITLMVIVLVWRRRRHAG